MRAAGPHPVLGKVLIASRVTTSAMTPGRMRAILLLLALSVGLQMTGFGIIMPIFARRLGEFESGVGSLALMMMSFALAQLLFAPVMGALADRWLYQGQRIVLCLPLHPDGGRRNLYATVIRCGKGDDGYQVGLQFDHASLDASIVTDTSIVTSVTAAAA